MSARWSSGTRQIIAGNQNWSHAASGGRHRLPDDPRLDDRARARLHRPGQHESSNVAVLGQTVAANLFPDGQSPIGRHPHPQRAVHGRRRAGEQGQPAAVSDQDDTCMIPYTHGQVRLFGATLHQSDPRPGHRSQQIDIATAQDEITALLRAAAQVRRAIQPTTSRIRNNADIISRVVERRRTTMTHAARRRRRRVAASSAASAS